MSQLFKWHLVTRYVSKKNLRVKKNFKFSEKNVWHVKKFFTCHLLITANAALVGGEEMVVKVEKQAQPQAQASAVAPVAGEFDFCFRDIVFVVGFGQDVVLSAKR